MYEWPGNSHAAKRTKLRYPSWYGGVMGRTVGTPVVGAVCVVVASGLRLTADSQDFADAEGFGQVQYALETDVVHTPADQRVVIAAGDN